MMMERVISKTKPNVEKFEYLWMIVDHPHTFTRPMHSPVIEAIGRFWKFQTAYHNWYRGHDKDEGYKNRLYIDLFPVDKDGNKIDVTDPNDDDKTVNDDPYFGASLLQAHVSFVKENGEVVSFPRVTDDKKRLNLVFDSQLTKNLLNTLANDTEIRSVQILFEFRVMIDQNDSTTSSSTAERTDTVDIKRLFGDVKFSDFSIRTGDGREIRAHRNILFLTSLYFEAMFNSGAIESKRGEIEVPEPYGVMNSLIHFLYTGKASEAAGGKAVSAVELFIAADKYQVTALKDQLEADVDALFSVENVCTELKKAHAGGIECMKSKAAKFIRANPKEVLEREDCLALCRDHPELVSYIFVPKM